MSVIGSDGLSLLVGDGGGTEIFNALKGASVARLEITQRNQDSSAVGTDAWAVSVGVSERRALVEVDALATDDAAAVRVRSLALSGAVGNFKLELSASQTLSFSAVVTQYREVIGVGAVKRMTARLESSGAGVIS